MPRRPILIVSAFEPEIAPLRRLLGETADVRLAAVGIGMVDAAIGAARALAAAEPVEVVFVGTAGAYPDSPDVAPIGAVRAGADLVVVSTAALRDQAYLPGPMVMRAETTLALRVALADAAGGAPPVTVACPLAITGEAGLALRIAATTGAALENLEAFAVARAAAAAGLPFGAVFGIANRVGPTAHDEWRAHHQAASDAACGALAKYLQQLEPGSSRP